MITIEGCIASGKTTIAQQLSNQFDSKLLLEKFESNPFLDKFYQNPIKYAIETELAFLLIHYHQLKDVHNNNPNQIVISDFYIKKDLLFAKLNLKNEEYQTFKSLYDFLSEQLPEPEIVICLHTSDSLILDRIKQRNRESEQNINTDYFVKLNHAYEQFFDEITCQKIHLDMDNNDFLTDKSRIEWLVNQVKKYI